MAASLGNAAGAMSCAYTQRKKDKESGAFEVAKSSYDLLSLTAAKELRTADADAAAFGALQATWKKDCGLSAAEKRVVEATALAVPVDLVDRCALNVETLREFLPVCNPSIVSDAKVGIHLLAGAARAAYATVLVNSPDDDVKRSCQAKLEFLRDAEADVLDLAPPRRDVPLRVAVAVAAAVAFALGRASAASAK